MNVASDARAMTGADFDDQDSAETALSKRRTAAKIKRKKLYLKHGGVAVKGNKKRWRKRSAKVLRRELREEAPRRARRGDKRHYNGSATATATKPPAAHYAEHVTNTLERIGRVRDIDQENGVFVAILNARTNSEPELIARFPISLIDPLDLDRLGIGMEFTLATSRHVLKSSDGKLAKPSLQTRIVIHRPPPLPEEREKTARERGRAVRARLLGPNQ